MTEAKSYCMQLALSLSPKQQQVVDHNVKKALKDYALSSLFMSKGRWLLNFQPLFRKMISNLAALF